MGRPEAVGADWIKPGATVIDVGINFVEDRSKPDGVRLCGDVDFPSVRHVAGAITPVPGGVGPMTVATLMRVRVPHAGHHTARPCMPALTQRGGGPPSPQNTLRNAERMLSAGDA